MLRFKLNGLVHVSSGGLSCAAASVVKADLKPFWSAISSQKSLNKRVRACRSGYMDRTGTWNQRLAESLDRAHLRQIKNPTTLIIRYTLVIEILYFTRIVGKSIIQSRRCADLWERGNRISRRLSSKTLKSDKLMTSARDSTDILSCFFWVGISISTAKSKKTDLLNQSNRNCEKFRDQVQLKIYFSSQPKIQGSDHTTVT